MNTIDQLRDDWKRLENEVDDMDELFTRKKNECREAKEKFIFSRFGVRVGSVIVNNSKGSSFGKEVKVHSIGLFLGDTPPSVDGFVKKKDGQFSERAQYIGNDYTVLPEEKQN